MRSPMIEAAEYIYDKKNYSDLQICHSGCGYYIGTMYYNPEFKFTEPGSRDSQYFETYEDAEKYLKELEEDKHLDELRTHP